MMELREIDEEVFNWFHDKHPSEWSRSHFSEESKCDILLNNLCESFNSTILAARDQAILTMLEWLREYLMTHWNTCRTNVERWAGPLCPKIQVILEKHGKTVGKLKSVKASRFLFQVGVRDRVQHAIDLRNKTCSCRRWQLTGIPCRHALCVIYKEKLNDYEYVDECYTTLAYKKAYEGIVKPISTIEAWGRTLFIAPLPPYFGKKLGRPATLRKKAPWEPIQKGKKRGRGKPSHKLRRFQTDIHCSNCKEPGDNVKNCPGLGSQPNRKRKRSHIEIGEPSNSKFDEHGMDEPGINQGDENAFVVSDNGNEIEDFEILSPNPVNKDYEAAREPEELGISQNTAQYTYADPPSQKGPSMFDQLKQSNPSIDEKDDILRKLDDYNGKKSEKINKKKRKAVGVKLRIPPKLSEGDIGVSQGSIAEQISDKNIVKKSGKKYLAL